MPQKSQISSRCRGNIRPAIGNTRVIFGHQRRFLFCFRFHTWCVFDYEDLFQGFFRGNKDRTILVLATFLAVTIQV